MVLLNMKNKNIFILYLVQKEGCSWCVGSKSGNVQQNQWKVETTDE